MPNSTSATPASTVGWDHQLGSPWSRRAHVGRLEPPGRPLAGPVKTATLPFLGRFWPAGGWRRLRAGRGARARRCILTAAVHFDSGRSRLFGNTIQVLKYSRIELVP